MEFLNITLDTLSKNIAAPISAVFPIKFKSDKLQSDALIYKAPPKLALFSVKLQLLIIMETLVKIAPPPIIAEFFVNLLLVKITFVPFKINKAPPYNPVLFVNIELLICKSFA